MRVIFDANVILSYLLAPNPQGTIARIVETSLAADDINVLLPPELAREIVDTAMNKPYFRGKISRERMARVLGYLTTHAQTLPELEDQLRGFVRDQKDDYLIAYGLVHDVDFLVTGDQDLLILRQVHGLKVLTPAGYLQTLNRELPGSANEPDS